MPAPPASVEELRSTMRRDLVTAMKTRDSAAVKALRTAQAAIDNAGAVEVDGGGPAVGGTHVAGAVAGIGSTEAVRRDLTLDDVRELIRSQVVECDEGAEQYDRLDQHEAADGLRQQADALRRYLRA